MRTTHVATVDQGDRGMTTTGASVAEYKADMPTTVQTNTGSWENVDVITLR